MATPSLLEGCQTLIEKGHESWKSYFSKWEAFAKYEEDIPESELFNEAEEKTNISGRKMKQTKPKARPSVKYKKKIQKRVIRRKREPVKCKQKVNTTEESGDSNNEKFTEEDTDSMNLEAILKSVLTQIVKTNRNEFQMLTILSQTVSGEVSNYSQYFHQETLRHNDFSKPLPLMPSCSVNVAPVLPHRNNFTRNLNCSWNFPESYRHPVTGIREQINSSLDVTFPLYRQINLNKPQFLSPLVRFQTLRQSTEVNSGATTSFPTLYSGLTNSGTKLKSLEWDSGLKSPNSVCRKINKEYFINRSLLKMNVAQDGKRSRNLCLRKRTNSITLSMENSNFITPERKPPERKCFSENVSQRKRTCPSKLFFGNEDEDSESDDETGKQTPVIRCRSKKRKTEIISEAAAASDSDDCDSIFDRVRTP